MAEEPKKISFGFSKISKKPAVIIPKKKEEKDIQFIDSLEGNSIKLVNGEETEKGALIIPLKNANFLRDNMIETLNARKEERTLKQPKNVKNDKKDIVNGTEQEAEKPLTLDELAAKEILEDLKKSHEKEEAPTVMEIPASNLNSVVEKESTLEDYQNVPIQEFGLAVLRGMGWTPESGVGKNGQIVQPVNPVVRPKGMGLGADKVISTTIASTSEELVLKKNALLKIVSGPYKNLYGKVEGFDELPGRLMVRLTLQNSVISISENLIQLVTAEEFKKFSKVLNLDDYNKFHDKKDEIIREDRENGNKANTIKSETNDLVYQSNKPKGRSPSNSVDRENRIRRQRKESRSPPSNARAEERYSKLKKEKKRSVSHSPEAERYRKPQKNINKAPSLDSDLEKRRRRDRKEIRRCRSSSSDKQYPKKKRDQKRKLTSSPEEQYRKTNRRRSPSESSESEETKKKSKKTKQKRRSPSESSESEEEEQRKRKKNRRKRETSEAEGGNRKRTFLKTRNSSSSSEEEKYQSSRHKEKINMSDSSETDMARSRKPEKKIKKSKHSKRDKYVSHSPPERTSKHKKHSHNYVKDRSRSRSPMNKKKKKKHHRSRI